MREEEEKGRGRRMKRREYECEGGEGDVKWEGEM